MLHNDFPSIVVFRIGLSVVGLIGIVISASKKLKDLQYWVLYGIILYLEFTTGIILGMVNADPVYMGGFAMILLLVPIFPFIRNHSLFLVIISLVMFVISGIMNNLSFITPSKQYALLNVFFAFVTSLLCIFVLDYIRRMSFSRQKLLVEKKNVISSQKKELQEALENIHVLKGLLPICSHCKSIRDSKGYWHSLELYIENHSDASFSHSLCQNCLKEFYPKLSDKIEQSMDEETKNAK